MNILLLAGTGTLGQAVTDTLHPKEIEIHVTSRAPRSEKANIKYLEGNATDDHFLDSLLKLKEWDVIIDFSVYKVEKFSKRVDKLLASTGHYIFLSSARVFSDAGGAPIKETSLRLVDERNDSEYFLSKDYALEKGRQENILFESEFKNWDIVRPYISYGSTRLQLGIFEKEEWLYRCLQSRPIPFPAEMLDVNTTMTLNSDVGEILSRLLLKRSPSAGAFNCVGDDARSWRQIIEIYRDSVMYSLKKKLEVEPVDLTDFIKIYGRRHQVSYDRMYNRLFDNSKIKDLCGNRDFVSPEQGIPSAVHEFSKSMSFADVNWRAEGKADRLTGVFSRISEVGGLRDMAKYVSGRFC